MHRSNFRVEGTLGESGLMIALDESRYLPGHSTISREELRRGCSGEKHSSIFSRYFLDREIITLDLVAADLVNTRAVTLGRHRRQSLRLPN